MVVDGRALAVPLVQQRVDGDRVQITMGGNREYAEIAAEAQTLADAMSAGAALESDWVVESITTR